ncbi:hypothetical protein BDZ89DRAFT_1074532 [Hymenopellis radicata]|nr:hypothetical protein BDZ89DRAFT_1074532 [Hymenopellis radicata]
MPLPVILRVLTAVIIFYLLGTYFPYVSAAIAGLWVYRYTSIPNAPSLGPRPRSPSQSRRLHNAKMRFIEASPRESYKVIPVTHVRLKTAVVAIQDSPRLLRIVQHALDTLVTPDMLNLLQQLLRTYYDKIPIAQQKDFSPPTTDEIRKFLEEPNVPHIRITPMLENSSHGVASKEQKDEYIIHLNVIYIDALEAAQSLDALCKFVFVVSVTVMHELMYIITKRFFYPTSTPVISGTSWWSKDEFVGELGSELEKILFGGIIHAEWRSDGFGQCNALRRVTIKKIQAPGAYTDYDISADFLSQYAGAIIEGSPLPELVLDEEYLIPKEAETGYERMRCTPYRSPNRYIKTVICDRNSKFHTGPGLSY